MTFVSEDEFSYSSCMKYLAYRKLLSVILLYVPISPLIRDCRAHWFVAIDRRILLIKKCCRLPRRDGNMQQMRSKAMAVT